MGYPTISTTSAAGFRAGAILAAVGAAHADAPAERNASPRVSTPMGTFERPQRVNWDAGRNRTEPRLGGIVYAYLIVAFFFDCFGHFQPMFRKSTPVLSVERSNRQFRLLATFQRLLTALVGLGHEVSSES